MNNGWIKLHRKSINSSVWKNPITWWVWSWCLMKATHQEYKFPFNKKDLTIKPGQFITGLYKACEELKISPQNYRTNIEYLSNTGRIAKKSTNKFTLITVLNWDKYQVEQQTNNKPVTNQQQHTIINKNGKNNYFSFKDGTRGFLDKRDGKWKECDTFKILGNVYLTELNK